MNNRSFWNFELGNAGCLASGKTLAIRCLAWAAALYAMTFGFLFASVFAPQWLNLSSFAEYVPALLVPIIGFGVYALLVRMGEKRRPTEIVFKPWSLIELAVGVVVGFAIMVVMLALAYAMGFYRVQIGHWSGWFNSLVFDSYISAMLEELAFRAILLRLFARMFNPVAGLVISSALFGVAHLTSNQSSDRVWVRRGRRARPCTTAPHQALRAKRTYGSSPRTRYDVRQSQLGKPSRSR